MHARHRYAISTVTDYDVWADKPVYKYDATATFFTMSISEYEGTVYALANNPRSDLTRINITNPYDIREIHTENIHDFYGNDGLSLRDNTVLSFEELPYIILTLTDSTGGGAVGGFRVLNYPYGFEAPTYAAISEANDGAEYRNLQSAADIDLVTLGEYTYALVASYGGGVQIINVTEPDSISAVLGISDGTGNFSTLNGAYVYSPKVTRSISAADCKFLYSAPSLASDIAAYVGASNPYG